MYADDHQLYEINKNLSTVNHNLNANATKASVWYKSNLLRGNLSKYHTMLITNKQVGNEFGVRVQGTDVECLNSFKSLGATIDNTLNFNEHVNIINILTILKIARTKVHQNFLASKYDMKQHSDAT